MLPHPTGVPSDPKAAALDLLRGPSGGARTLFMEVRGESMAPTLRAEDRVEVEGAEATDLRLGDLVVVQTSESGWIIHRFFGFRPQPPGALRTKGDARPYFDPVWPGSRLVGRVRSLERGGRRKRLSRPWLLWGAARSVAGWLVTRTCRPPRGPERS